MIEPKILKGFRDSLPQEETIRENLIDKVKKIFKQFGFSPIDTPAIEYSEVLLGKGGGETDKQIFRFTDNGGRDVALRFDLTVPLARYVAANKENLVFPFKRYHIAKVWRGEKPQKGRYREFLQCDFDIIGADTPEADFEILLLIHTCLNEMQVGPFKVLVSHRGLLKTFLEKEGLSEKEETILHVIDKKDKVGSEAVVAMLREAGINNEKINKILEFISIKTSSFEETLQKTEEIIGKNENTERLESLLNYMKDCNIQDSFVLDLSITRGLDYYTGLVYETTLLSAPAIGSICSGGRYNNLSGLYSKTVLPGVGSCIGLDRLIAALQETGSKILENSFNTEFCIANKPWAHKTAQQIRAKGINVNVITANKDNGQVFAYAEKMKIPYVITEFFDCKFTVKEILTRKVYTNLTFNDLLSLVSK